MTALAGTTLPPPRTLTKQLELTPIAGEYSVTEVDYVQLDDGWWVTHLALKLTTAVQGDDLTPTLVLPGGMVDGEFSDPEGFGTPFVVGEVIFLMMRPAVDLPGLYVLFYGYGDAMYRRVQSHRGWVTVDGFDRFVVDLPCDGIGVRAVSPLVAGASDQDSDENGTKASPALLPGIIQVDDPLDASLTWETALTKMTTCGRDQ